MNNLIIIGNGFDLFHEIPTTYYNFKEYLEQKGYYEFINSLEKYLCSSNLWKDFESELAELDTEELKSDPNGFLRFDFGLDDWSDSYHHDYQYEIERELEFQFHINKYLFEWISTLDINKPKKFSIKVINNSNFYLNFNYTSTLQTVYKINSERICYIHGNSSSTNELIIGHGKKGLFNVTPKSVYTYQNDEYEEIDYRIRDVDDIILPGYFKNTYKSTSKIIEQHRNFFNSLINIDNVYILGHSLSDIDLPYFEEIMNIINNKKNKWIVTYHKLEEIKTHTKQLIKIGLDKNQINLITMPQIGKIL